MSTARQHYERLMARFDEYIGYVEKEIKLDKAAEKLKLIIDTAPAEVVAATFGVAARNIDHRQVTTEDLAAVWQTCLGLIRLNKSAVLTARVNLVAKIDSCTRAELLTMWKLVKSVYEEMRPDSARKPGPESP